MDGSTKGGGREKRRNNCKGFKSRRGRRESTGSRRKSKVKEENEK